MEKSIEELKQLHAIAKTGEATKERNKTIAHLRYVDGLTLQAIGTRYGLTRERVRQIINQTLK
jgi:DNA-directed RNA polymerase sigma subunit (sigma70/sigma32)